MLKLEIIGLSWWRLHGFSPTNFPLANIMSRWANCMKSEEIFYYPGSLCNTNKFSQSAWHHLFFSFHSPKTEQRIKVLTLLWKRPHLPRQRRNPRIPAEVWGGPSPSSQRSASLSGSRTVPRLPPTHCCRRMAPPLCSTARAVAFKYTQVCVHRGREVCVYMWTFENVTCIVCQSLHTSHLTHTHII